MKIVGVGFGFFMVFILALSIVMALGKNNAESEKLAEVVEVAIYQSLKEGIEKQEDPGAIFEDNVAVLLDDDVYLVTILESDYEKGILSVSVELFYENMGKARAIEVERTVIYEREAA